MAWWPFGRKKRKDKSDKTSKTLPSEGVVTEKESYKYNTPAPVQSAPQSPEQRPTKEEPKAEPPSTPPSAIRNDYIEHEHFESPPTQVTPYKQPSRSDSQEDITALPVATEVKRSPHLRPVPEQGPIPQSSFFSRRTTTEPTSSTRKKSVKRKRDDHARQEQIRAMSSPIPIPKKPGETLGLFRRSSGQSNRDFGGVDSTTSLPTVPSVRSSMTGVSDHRFEVGGFDVFSARPKIRHSLQGHASSTAIRSTTSRADSKKASRPVSQSPGGADEDLDRIDHLADNYDTGTLRELMDRDKRRREKRRKDEEDRARRRLERLAAKAEAGPSDSKDRPRSSRRKEESSTKVSEAGGVAPSTPTKKHRSSKKRPGRSRTESQGQQSHGGSEYYAASERSIRTGRSVPRTPFGGEVPVIETAVALRYSHGSMSQPSEPVPPVPPIPQSPQLKEFQPPPRSTLRPQAAQSVEQPTAASAGPTKESSEAAPGRIGGIASFIRRSLTGKATSDDRNKEAAPTSSFVNLSREEKSKQPLPAHLVQDSPTLSRASSGTPTRKGSKFREDLPDAPSSPPESRMQSPGLPGTSPVDPQSAVPSDPLDPRPESFGSVPIAAVPLSQSLASVDSEGSWLSGRPRKRTSQQMPSSMLAENPEERTRSYENLGMPEDQYFRKLTPQPEQQSNQRGGISAGLTSQKQDEEGEGDDEEDRESIDQPDAEEQVSSGEVSRKPTIVHRQQRVQSTEGLLNVYHQDGKDTEGDSSAYDTDDAQDDNPRESFQIHEATTGVGIQHARNISGGSAKILEIPKRNSLRLSRSQTPTGVPENPQ